MPDGNGQYIDQEFRRLSWQIREAGRRRDIRALEILAEELREAIGRLKAEERHEPPRAL